MYIAENIEGLVLIFFFSYIYSQIWLNYLLFFIITTSAMSLNWGRNLIKILINK
jgi:hypothetical protein